MSQAERHKAILINFPGGIEGDLPHVAVGIADIASISVMRRRIRRTYRRPAGSDQLLDHGLDIRLIWDIVRQGKSAAKARSLSSQRSA